MPATAHSDRPPGADSPHGAYRVGTVNPVPGVPGGAGGAGSAATPLPASRTARGVVEAEQEEDRALGIGARVWAFVRGPYPTLVSRLVLGFAFVLAGLTKLGLVGALTATIESYELPLPSFLVTAMAYGLPPLELLVGVWLLMGLFTRVSAAVTAALLLVFLVAIGQGWARGIAVDCGCFGGATITPIGAALISALGPLGTWLTNEELGLEIMVRDGVMFLMALHLVFVPTVWGIDPWRRAVYARRYGTQSEDSEDDEYVAEYE